MHVLMVIAALWIVLVTFGACACRWQWGRWPDWWLFTANFGFFQFFGVRLVQVDCVSAGAPNRVLGYFFDHGMLPFTGWWSTYVRLWKPRKVPKKLIERELKMTRSASGELPLPPDKE
jgi:hypothetical protein